MAANRCEFEWHHLDLAGLCKHGDALSLDTIDIRLCLAVLRRFDRVSHDRFDGAGQHWSVADSSRRCLRNDDYWFALRISTRPSGTVQQGVFRSLCAGRNSGFPGSWDVRRFSVLVGMLAVDQQ